MALSDGVSDASPSGPPISIVGSSERAGLPSVRRVAASVTAGSTSQVRGRLPAAIPKSVSARSRPPAESVRVQAGRSADPAVRVVTHEMPDRHHEGGVHGAGVLAADQRQEGARLAVGDGVARDVGRTERVHTEPVDAGVLTGIRLRGTANEYCRVSPGASVSMMAYGPGWVIRLPTKVSASVSASSASSAVLVIGVSETNG